METLALMRGDAVRDQALLQTLLNQRDQLLDLLGSLRGMLNDVSSGRQGHDMKWGCKKEGPRPHSNANFFPYFAPIFNMTSKKRFLRKKLTILESSSALLPSIHRRFLNLLALFKKLKLMTL